MRVSVSGKQFVFPRSCACCGSYPMTSLPVSGTEKNRKARTKGWIWDIPYCMACKRHIRLAEAVLVAALGLSAISFISGFVTAILTGRWISGLAIVVFLLVVTVLGCWMLWWYVKVKRPINCCGQTRAVLYLGSSGACHTFDIKSGFYGADFVRANHRKIVNASTQVASILRNTQFGDFHVARRIVRRREHGS
jgi:hypothetical protein